MKAQQQFDREYYSRFYHRPGTRVGTRRQTGKLASYTCAFARHLGLPVKSVLDFGCGLGWWGEALRREFPGVRYTGVEVSEYLIKKYGWLRGSVAGYKHPKPVDLVICQGVLQYLDRKSCERALENLAGHCRGILYLEALTSGDWNSVCDRNKSDSSVHLRSGPWYFKRLRRHFLFCGGGLFVSRRVPLHLFEFEARLP